MPIRKIVYTVLTFISSFILLRFLTLLTKELAKNSNGKNIFLIRFLFHLILVLAVLIGAQGIYSPKACAMQQRAGAGGQPKEAYLLDQYREQADRCNIDCQVRYSETSELEKRFGDDRVRFSNLEWAIMSPKMSPEIKELYVGRIRPLLSWVATTKPLSNAVLEEHALAIEMDKDVKKSDTRSFEAHHEQFVTKRAHTAERWSALEGDKLTIAGEADKIRETIRPNNSPRLIEQIRTNSQRPFDQINSQQSQRLLQRIRPVPRR